MNPKHKEILDKLEDYLNRPNVDQLRFWQALRNCNIICFKDIPNKKGIFDVVDDYNISDDELLKRIK